VVLGEIPAGHPLIRPLVQRGEAGLVLVNTACYPDDLLVVGAGRRSALTLAVSGKVCHYCVAHAHCPVVTVPPPDFARELTRALCPSCGYGGSPGRAVIGTVGACSRCCWWPCP
jgi:hypothetical protein